MMVVAALVSCSADTSAPELQVQAAISDSSEQHPSNTDAAPPITTIDVNAEFTDQACFDCHTDQERLVELAVEDEVVEVPSEGPG